MGNRNWIGRGNGRRTENGKLLLLAEKAVGGGWPFFLMLGALFAGGPVVRLQKSTIFADVHLQEDELSV
jgi:hypothetical protein